MWDCDVRADVSARRQIVNKGSEIFLREGLFAIYANETVLLDPVVRDERRTGMSGRPADHAGIAGVGHARSR